MTQHLCRLVKAAALMVFLSVGTAFSAQEQLDPEVTTHREKKQGVVGDKQMVVTANPHASAAAMTILNAGGSAIDAAIAAQLVLTLVEPQSSGIGGGAFMLFFDAEGDRLLSFDGRETAPAAAKPNRFLKPDGQPMGWLNALVGGRSVGVPGVVAMMAQAHEQGGQLPWKTLFEPAIELASNGFEVSPRLAGLLAKRHNPGLAKLEPAASYFYPEGKPLQAGQLLVNKPLANTLTILANEGHRAFYEGPMADRLAATVQSAAQNPGDLTSDDLANYQPLLREPLCAPYRGYRICSMAPPSSGGIAVAQTLLLLNDSPMADMASLSIPAVHRFAQASKLAFADRGHYIGDPDFVRVPIDGLLDEAYLAERRALIDPKKNMAKAVHGAVEDARRGDDESPELPSTSHMSIVDRQGNAVSMTSSIEMAFGSGLMVNGFLLNNQLTDFSFSPAKNGVLVANSVLAGKRPRSSMAPVMVFDDNDDLYLVVGSPGGSRIINYVSQVLIAVIDGDLDIQQAINLPRVSHRNDYLALETGNWPEQTIETFEDMGYKVKVRDLNSGLHGIQRVKNGWLGGADPRREGVAVAN
ncbi:gamma-glutamyltransferase [Neiella marina]|uniref:Glutathione hydrolase proenzyme n=1 Tax=Neiella holothuriorum TaxID=2870530 RepID=A0ABS7EF96_9GAMM|nr:gamma-glutamyltransferase [Neiella holothuriorum]MBW8191005.1 gamma-glutamyltransferase [Neiella holothuriorum]